MEARIEGELDWPDLRDNSKLHLQMTRMDRFVLYLLLFWLAFLFLGGTYYFLRGELDPKLILQLYFTILLFAGLYWVSIRQDTINAKKRFLQMRNTPLAHYVLAFTKEGVQVPQDAHKVFLPWSNFILWKESQNTFLLYLSKNEYLFVPKRLCPSPALPDEIRSHLIAAGVRNAAAQLGFRSVISAVFFVVFTILFFSVVFIPALLR
jgi:hypothetical protein